MPGRIPLLIDVDTGIDDSLALLYAAASPEADLLGVTCVSGNIDLPRVQRNTRAVLELAGRDDVEVAAGRPIPLIRPLEIAPETHGPDGLGYAVLPEPRLPLSDRFGPDLIVDVARARPGQVTLITLGPVTNLAVALLREPELPRLLKRWVLMGGAYRVPGNTSPTTEWNIHCDPEAAKLAFTAFAAGPGIARPLALGLDVTERAKLTPDHLVALARRAGSTPDDTLLGASGDGDSAAETRSVAANPVVRFLADALRFYMEFHSRFDGFYGAFVHDPLAVAATLDPAIVRTEAVAVDVETAGTLTVGQTVTDWRHHWDRQPNVDVASEADVATFFDRFTERVGGLAKRLGQEAAS
jgi:purine nucleosidase